MRFLVWAAVKLQNRDSRCGEQTAAAAHDGAAIAHLGLLALIDSDRQVTWATTIRAQRLAAIISTAAADDADGRRACCLITDAKWWIDQRDLPDPDLLKKAAQHVIKSKFPAAPDTSIVIAWAARP